MKIETIGRSPSGKSIINLRLGVADLEILKGLLRISLMHTPETYDTRKTVQRMRAMSKCLNSTDVAAWAESAELADRPSGWTACEICDGTGNVGWSRSDPPDPYICGCCDGKGWVTPKEVKEFAEREAEHQRLINGEED